jgi:hypothetical protein
LRAKFFVFLRYILSLLPFVLTTCWVLTQLNFATRAHVVAGSVHEERWEHDFTLDLGGGKYHSLDERTRLALAEGIANVCVCAGGALTTFWTVLTIKDGYQSSGFWWFEGGWVVCAIIAALTVAAWVRATMVTVLVEDDSISFARGRRASRWIKARWSELRDVRVMSRTHQGTTTEWIQVVLPDGKKLKIPESITDYSTLRETMLKHAHGAAPQQ